MSRTLADALNQYEQQANARLQPWFKQAKIPYPPAKIALLGFKAEKNLELWARHDKKWIWIRDYPILAASGVAGPKLREGDLQVPEGIYRINLLNPNSKFHLSMQIDYPNSFDRHHAKLEQRTQLGGEIFIHGKAASIGCLAIGDLAIEELFTLVATVGMTQVKVILAPQREMSALSSPPAEWISKLYQHISRELEHFPRSR
jgi:murein L,D-transpeptidase YafK